MKKNILILLIAVFVLSSFVVANADVNFSFDKESYVLGDTITLTFSGADGDANAWFAVYPDDEGKIYQDYATGEKVWKYANSDSEDAGSAAASDGVVTFNTSKLALGAGTYKCTYFPNVSYTVGKTVTLTIKAEGENPGTSDVFNIMSISLVSLLALALIKKKAFSA